MKKKLKKIQIFDNLIALTGSNPTKKLATFFEFNISTKFLLIYVSHSSGHGRKNGFEHLSTLMKMDPV